MLNEVDKETLKYDILIKFCEEHNIKDIDAHYYLKLGYESVKDKIEDNIMEEFLDKFYLAMDEHFYQEYRE